RRQFPGGGGAHGPQRGQVPPAGRRQGLGLRLQAGRRAHVRQVRALSAAAGASAQRRPGRTGMAGLAGCQTRRDRHGLGAPRRRPGAGARSLRAAALGVLRRRGCAAATGALWPGAAAGAGAEHCARRHHAQRGGATDPGHPDAARCHLALARAGRPERRAPRWPAAVRGGRQPVAGGAVHGAARGGAQQPPGRLNRQPRRQAAAEAPGHARDRLPLNHRLRPAPRRLHANVPGGVARGRQVSPRNYEHAFAFTLSRSFSLSCSLSLFLSLPPVPVPLR
ncbi:unnamed protein product, partial [Prorocentrum cordatum]